MPILIRELHIKVTVNETPGGNAPAPASGSQNPAEEEREAIVSECVEQVLTVLRDKLEK